MLSADRRQLLTGQKPEESHRFRVLLLVLSITADKITG